MKKKIYNTVIGGVINKKAAAIKVHKVGMSKLKKSYKIEETDL
ncbi:MAG TPA: hypothetical protein VF303_00075 [Candidatus Nanoarchaeia archaeon]